MAIPSNDAVLAALKGAPKAAPKVTIPPHAQVVQNLGGSYTALPKPQMTNLVPISQTFEGNTGTMGKKTFADYTPAIQNAPAEVQKGIERLQLYDTEGNIIPKKSDITFSPTSMPGSTPAAPAIKQESAVTFLGNILDRISGGIVTPSTGAPLENAKIAGLDIKIPQKFSQQALQGAQGAFGEKIGTPIGIALGIIGDPLNLLTGPEGAVGKLKLINDLRDAKNATEAANVLRAAKVPADLIPQYAEKFGVMTDKVQIGQGVDHLIQTLETTKQAMQAEEGAARALKTIAEQQKAVPAGVVANAAKVAEKLGIKQPVNVQENILRGAPIYRGEGADNAGGNFYTFDRAVAERYAGKNGKVVENVTPAKTLDLYSADAKVDAKLNGEIYDQREALVNSGKKVTDEALYEPVWNRGYNAVVISDHMTGEANILLNPAFKATLKNTIHNPLPVVVEENIAAQTAQEIELAQGGVPGKKPKPLTAEEKLILNDAKTYETLDEFIKAKSVAFDTTTPAAKARLTEIFNQAKGIESAATRSVRTVEETARASILEARATALTDEAAKATDASEKATIMQQLKLTTDELEALKTKMEGFEKTGIEQAQTAVPRELKALAAEARKYETAEKFVNSQKSFFHTTSAENASSIERSGFKPQIGDRSLGVANAKGIWLYENASPTKEFSKNFKNPAVVEAKVSGKIFDGMNYDKSIRALAEDKRLIAKLKSEGYVGIRGDELGTPATFIFEPSAVKTKSQLTDLYNRATKLPLIQPQKFKGDVGALAEASDVAAKASAERRIGNLQDEIKQLQTRGLTGQSEKAEIDRLQKIYNIKTPKTPMSDVNLVKAISAEKKPHAITEMLKDTFPKMSEKTLDVFSQRMAQYTRASDIEGLLSSLQRLATQADETGQRILDATLPESVRSALTPRQAQLNVELLTRQIKTPENSAIAEAEYSALWEHADQRVIDRFNEANVEKGILEEVIDAHPGKFFSQFRLPGQAYEDMDIAESLAKGLKTGGKNRTIDTYFAEQGVEDAAGAQKKLEDFLALRAHLKDLQIERRELKPHVRSAQIVRGMLDELPVVPNRRISAIDEMANTADIRSTYKDISGFSGGFRDMYRNFEHFFGSRFQDVKEAVLDPFDAAKGEYVDRYNAFGDAVKENVVDKFGFKRGSEESKAIQDWGERSLMSHPSTANPDSVYHTEEALVAKFGEEKAREIKKAATWFRQEYDRVIDEINDVRKKIYPNNPSKLIAKRKDYFRHYQEFGSSVMDAVRNFMDVPSGIEPKLVGISEFTKPKSKFLSLAQLRKGPISERDAIGGFLDYAPAASYAINIDPQIGVFRYLRRKLAEKAPLAGSTENQAVQPGIDNFLQFLDDFSNNLATKTNPVDRWIQKRIPGGRATMKAMDWINGRVKANTILGNLGSSFAQMANIPQGIASAKQYSIQGAARTLASILEPNTAMKESTFLKERYLYTLKDRFPIDFKSKPIRATTEATARVAASFLKIGDQIGTHFIWNSHYAKAVAEGMKNPVKYADDMTRKLVAGRGIGELPVDQQAKITQMLAPFTVEVQNLWWILKDQVKARDFHGLAVLLVANYLFNEVSERTRGSRVVYDPVNALIEGAASLQREASKGNLARGGMEFTGRQIGEVASNVPFGQDVTALLPDSLFGMKKTDIFGQGDPNRFGPPVLLAGAIKNPLWRVAPPFGGAQLQKTYNGIVGLMQGQATSASGKTNFPIASTPGNIVRSLIFGPNSTSEAQASFATGDELHQRLATQDVMNKQAAADAEQKWTELKALKASGGNVTAEWAQIGKDNPQLLTRLKQIGKDEALGLTANDRLVSMLNVGNGERANYIADQINSLKTKEEKQTLWKEYVTKKLLTPDVQIQVKPLIEGTNTGLTK